MCVCSFNTKSVRFITELQNWSEPVRAEKLIRIIYNLNGRNNPSQLTCEELSEALSTDESFHLQLFVSLKSRKRPIQNPAELKALREAASPPLLTKAHECKHLQKDQKYILNGLNLSCAAPGGQIDGGLAGLRMAGYPASYQPPGLTDHGELKLRKWHIWTFTCVHMTVSCRQHAAVIHIKLREASVKWSVPLKAAVCVVPPAPHTSRPRLCCLLTHLPTFSTCSGTRVNGSMRPVTPPQFTESFPLLPAMYYHTSNVLSSFHNHRGGGRRSSACLKHFCLNKLLQSGRTNITGCRKIRWVNVRLSLQMSFISLSLHSLWAL